MGRKVKQRTLKLLVNQSPPLIIEDEIEIEEIDATLCNLGGLIAILEQFPARDARVVRFREREKHKRLA